MDEKKKKLDDILEGYKPIPMKRMFYPRGMKLSEDFVNAFHREYDRLVGEGLNPKTLVERFGKAMKFHQNESRKYHQLDEEKMSKEEDKKLQDKLANEKQPAHEGDRGEAKRTGKKKTTKFGKQLQKWADDDS